MVIVYVWGTWGMDGGWMPLHTRPQRYCDPASLVSRDLSFDETEKRMFLMDNVTLEKREGKTNKLNK